MRYTSQNPPWGIACWAFDLSNFCAVRCGGAIWTYAPKRGIAILTLPSIITFRAENLSRSEASSPWDAVGEVAFNGGVAIDSGPSAITYVTLKCTFFWTWARGSWDTIWTNTRRRGRQTVLPCEKVETSHKHAFTKLLEIKNYTITNCSRA